MPRSRKYDGVVYRRKETPFWWIRYRDRSGARRRESTFTQDWQEAQRLLRERLQARDSNALDVIRKGEKLSLEQWADFFLENYSKPPVRAEKTHQVNLRVAKHLKNAFASRKMVDITADDIEIYLSDRLRKTVRVRTALGYRQMGVLKPTTVHQELRVLRRMLNVAVRKKLLQANPCWGVEFPVAVRGLFRPHYVTWSEQRRIESQAPPHIRNIVHHGDGTQGLQGTNAYEKRPSGPCKCHYLDTRLQNTERYCRNSSDSSGDRSHQKPDTGLGNRALLVPKRQKSVWSPKES